MKASKNEKSDLLFMVLVIFLISIIMCVSSFGIATWARYRTATGGNVTAQIAKWSFKVNKQSEEFAQINLADTISFEHVEKTTIAPGTYGSFNLEIDGTGSEVSLDYYIDIDVLQKATNMKFYTESSHSASSELQIVNNKIQLENEILLTDTPMTKTEIIYWDWAYRTNTYPSQEVINKYLTEQPIDGLQTLVNEYNADGTTDSRKAEIALKINDLIDTKEAGGELLLPIKVTGIQKYPGGLEPKGISITSSTTMEYNIDDTLTFALEFTEGVYADASKNPITEENAPEIMIEFEELDVAQNPVAKVASLVNTQIKIASGIMRKAEFVSVEKNKINYKYVIQKGDRGIVKIASVIGSVYDKNGNKTEITQNNKLNIMGETANSVAKELLKINVGDKVYYEPSGEYVLDKSKAQSGKSSVGSNAETGIVTLSSKTDGYKIKEWYVLSVDGEKIELVPSNQSQYGIKFQGANGYNNAVKILNDVCSKLYSDSSKGITARSINIEDIENCMNKADILYNEKTWNEFREENTPIGGIQYNDISSLWTKAYYPLIYEKEKRSKIIGLNGDAQNTTGLDISESSGVYIAGNASGKTIQVQITGYRMKYEELSNYLGDVYKKILLNNDSATSYWIASRNIWSNSKSYCSYGISNIASGSLSNGAMYFSDDGLVYEDANHIFPVVTLNSNLLQKSNTGDGFEVITDNNN